MLCFTNHAAPCVSRRHGAIQVRKVLPPITATSVSISWTGRSLMFMRLCVAQSSGERGYRIAHLLSACPDVNYIQYRWPAPQGKISESQDNIHKM